MNEIRRIADQNSDNVGMSMRVEFDELGHCLCRPHIPEPPISLHFTHSFFDTISTRRTSDFLQRELALEAS